LMCHIDCAANYGDASVRALCKSQCEEDCQAKCPTTPLDACLRCYRVYYDDPYAQNDCLIRAQCPTVEVPADYEACKADCSAAWSACYASCDRIDKARWPVRAAGCYGDCNIALTRCEGTCSLPRAP
jgi:hypothetical protein